MSEMPLKLFEEQDCVSCGVRFGVPVGFTENHRKSKEQFYCPNGHGMSYSQSEADRLRIERDRLAQRIAQKDDEIAEQRAEKERQRLRAETLERKVSAARGQVTKIKKRAFQGICPCCNRQFVNLQLHMHSKHPGFVAEPTADEHVH